MAYNREEKNTCYAPPQTNKKKKKMRCHVTSKQKANSQSVKFFGTCFIMSLYQHAQLAAILNVNLLYAWHMDGLFQVFVFLTDFMLKVFIAYVFCACNSSLFASLMNQKVNSKCSTLSYG